MQYVYVQEVWYSAHNNQLRPQCIHVVAILAIILSYIIHFSYCGYYVFLFNLKRYHFLCIKCFFITLRLAVFSVTRNID